jgi:hypothetical protein
MQPLAVRASPTQCTAEKNLPGLEAATVTAQADRSTTTQNAAVIAGVYPGAFRSPPSPGGVEGCSCTQAAKPAITEKSASTIKFKMEGFVKVQHG